MPAPTSGRRDDSRDLAAFGYKQQLERGLGSFSSFAAGFSYISILTGIFQTFYMGFNAGGPAFFWTWPVVFAGQFLVALGFAELAAHYPVSGSVYQWSKQIGHPAIGWMSGWIYLACLTVTLAAVALALQITLPQIIPWFQFIGSGHDPADRAANAVVLGCLLIAFTTLINSIGVRLLARINNLGVFCELVGAVLLIILLAIHARHGASALLDTQHKGAGAPHGYLGPFLAAMALTASYVMYGFDTAGSLAEETHDPRKTSPRAILQALTAAAAAGALLLLFAMLAAGELADPRLRQDDGGLPYLVNQTLGKGLGTLFLCDVVFAITVCALAVHTGAIRLTFAMARDNKLPFSPIVAHVSSASRTPIVAALISGIIAAVILIANINFPSVIEVVISTAILWANLAYLLVTATLLVARFRGWPAKGDWRGFTLGASGLPINILAVGWGTFAVANIAWPRPRAGASWYEQYAALLLTGGLALIGSAYYGLVERKKIGVLDEHRA